MKKLRIQKDLGFLLRDKYKGNWQKEFLVDAERIKEGEPVDFVIGWMPFLNCVIDLRYRPLIPRPETEYWTELAIKEIGNRKDVKVLDIFSGSGAIGIAVLKNCKNARVDFGEYEPDLVKQITFNIKLNKLEKRKSKVFKSDVFKNIKGKYNFILANPPYIPLARKKKVHPSAVKYEKPSSLWGGKDGLYFIKKFLAEAKEHLLPNGQIWMEYDAPEKSKIEKICKAEGYVALMRKDHYGRYRYLVARRKGG